MYYRSFQAHNNSSINSLCLIKSTNFVLSGGGNDCLIRLHNLNNDSVQSTTFPKEHITAVNSIDVSSSGETFVSGGGDTINVWDLVKQCKLMRYQSINDQIRDEVYDCKILNDSLVVSCGTNCFVNFHDLRQPKRTKPIYSVKAGNDNLNSLDYNPISKVLSVGSLDGRLTRIDLRNQEVIRDTFECGGLLNVRLCPRDMTLITFENGKLKLCDSNDLLINSEVTLSNDKLTYRIASDVIKDYYSDTEYIMSGSETGIVYLWKHNPTDQTVSEFKILEPPLLQYTDKSRILSVVKFIASSNRLICSSENGLLHIWENVL
ncbi:uncharacterized protein AC631_00798 [Debaryomyces fabryi]|uniref:Uncharacterized protein n=1 Tax=Debaryomyces fabryi TaxID=58627 RepID=A0A0V1Q547_9ASCO|nr:uncharacterized protein AC631_00798 [Debaryomyces fabryi]KSA03482.1 hypothetical protein AC631_00798 [Debaryomyces fabryi]CUM53652.1 unnamed protein product [Debaryomyces fabryi]